jgi:CheY-like chemotaxis protein
VKKEEIKILIAEDEIIIALDITSTLKQMGYQNISRVQSGEMMIEKFKSEAPDLIITDIMLKGQINGIEAAKQIKNIKDIPFLFIAGFGGKDFFKEAAQISPNGLITKPFDSNILEEKINSLLARRTNDN